MNMRVSLPQLLLAIGVRLLSRTRAFPADNRGCAYPFLLQTAADDAGKGVAQIAVERLLKIQER